MEVKICSRDCILQHGGVCTDSAEPGVVVAYLKRAPGQPHPHSSTVYIHTHTHTFLLDSRPTDTPTHTAVPWLCLGAEVEVKICSRDCILQHGGVCTDSAEPGVVVAYLKRAPGQPHPHSSTVYIHTHTHTFLLDSRPTDTPTHTAVPWLCLGADVESKMCSRDCILHDRGVCTGSTAPGAVVAKRDR